MKSEVYKRKVDARDKLLARILDAAARIKEGEDQSDEQHAIFAREMQSVLAFKAEISNIYREV